MASRWTKYGSLALVGALAMLLWDTPVIWPLKILVVLFHELGHALAALATGGSVVSIELSPQQGGLTRTMGGNRFLVLSSGYLGSLAFGVLWLFLGRSPRTARVGVWMLAGVLLGSTALWVRPLISFGFLYALVASAAVVALARWAPAAASQHALRGLGVFSVLYALWDIRDDVLARPGISSDATMLAEFTFIPGPVWGVAWIAVGVATLWALRRWLT